MVLISGVCVTSFPNSIPSVFVSKASSKSKLEYLNILDSGFILNMLSVV